MPFSDEVVLESHWHDEHSHEKVGQGEGDEEVVRENPESEVSSFFCFNDLG